MKDLDLSEVEVRVLGCLIEKEMATPDYYPLSLNALALACNQKSNRHPVTSLTEPAILAALAGLIDKKVAYKSDAGRVTRYGHLLDKKYNLVAKEMAVLCLLLLRGQQTAGELRSRSERLHNFASTEEVNGAVLTLREVGFVIKLERMPGQKEARFSHLLAGQPAPEAESGPEAPEPATEVRALAELEREIDELREQLQELQREFAQFKKQFE